MKSKLLLTLGGAAIAALSAGSALAANSSATQDTSYASQAIASGDLAQAEKALKPVSYADAADPARLINLATVYAQTNRVDRARAILAQVQQLPDEALEMADGVSRSSHRIATAMLKRLP